MKYKSYDKEYKEEQAPEKLTHSQRDHRKAYSSKTCDTCGEPGFQPHNNKLLCYQCYENAYGNEGKEPYDRDKFKAKLDTIKDPSLQRYVLNLAKAMRGKNETTV